MKYVVPGACVCFFIYLVFLAQFDLGRKSLAYAGWFSEVQREALAYAD